MFKAAIIGAGGYWAKNVIRTLLENQDVEITVLCDTNIEAAKLVAKKFRLTEALVCSDFAHYSVGKKEFQEADGIFIITPPITHYGIAQYFLSMGKNCLVEKPLTIRTCDAIELNELADRNKCVLMVGHTFLYSSAILKIKELIKDEKIFYIDTERLNMGIVREDINASINLAPHDISTCNFLMDDMPERGGISATGSAFINKNMEDVVNITLRYPRNRTAYIMVSWYHPLKSRIVKVISDKHMYVANDLNSEAPLLVYDNGFDYIPPDGEKAYGVKLRSGSVCAPKISGKQPLTEELLHFIDCCQNGTKCRTDGINGLEVVEVLEQAQKCLKGETK